MREGASGKYLPHSDIYHLDSDLFISMAKDIASTLCRRNANFLRKSDSREHGRYYISRLGRFEAAPGQLGDVGSRGHRNIPHNANARR